MHGWRVGTRLLVTPPSVAAAASTKAGEKTERCQSAQVAGACARAAVLSASGATVSSASDVKAALGIVTEPGWVDAAASAASARNPLPHRRLPIGPGQLSGPCRARSAAESQQGEPAPGGQGWR